MRRTLALTTAGALLTLAPAGTWAQTPNTTAQHLEHLMIDNADTPAEHQALARYYRMKAADAKELAAEHRSMARSYTGGNVASLRSMKQHCDRIAELNEQLAAQYEDLAKGEDAAAKM
jgi:hypothetical protein